VFNYYAPLHFAAAALFSVFDFIVFSLVFILRNSRKLGLQELTLTAAAEIMQCPRTKLGKHTNSLSSTHKRTQRGGKSIARAAKWAVQLF